jgi:hypothetical protein
MLLQEVGFDIVPMWGQMGFVAKGVVILIALAGLFLLVFLISRLLKRA